MTNLHQQTSQSILGQLDILARTAVDRQVGLQAQLWKPGGKPIDPARHAKSIRDVGYHFAYLSEALAANDSALFLDYVGWAKVLFVGLNFPPEVLSASLHSMNHALQATLQPDLAATAGSYLDAAIEHLPYAPVKIEPFIRPDAPCYQLADQYLKSLLQGNRRAASRLILDAVEHGVGVQDIYLYVFQTSQQELGRLWQTNQVSVAQEHFCSASTQLIMSQLYPYIFAGEKSGPCLVATSVGSELHEIGIRMVTDFLEMAGWDTYYLGANTPPESVISAIVEQQAQVVAVSATMTFHVREVAALIERIRASASASRVKIMVGGYPFNVAKDLWQQIGADGYARDAQAAVTVANQLVESRP
jgi:methanogenic corrinoid protein MtbC1